MDGWLAILWPFIGVGRFRILGGQGLEYWGKGEFPAGTWRRNDVDATYRRHIDVISTSCAQLVFNKSVQNNYISHLIIWYYRKSRDSIERNSFASTFKSLFSQLLLLLFYPSTWYICDFSCFTQKSKENVGGLLGGGGGGGQKVCCPPLNLLGAWPLWPPLPTPMPFE